MNNDQKIVKWVGALFLVQLIAAAISYSVILEPLLSGPGFLSALAAHPIRVKISILLDLLCGTAITAIAVLLYPILKRYNRRIALWYVALRVLEFAAIFFTVVFLLTLLSTGKLSLETGTHEATNLDEIGVAFRASWGWTKDMSLIAYCLGSGPFYYLLFASGMLPRFISLWGVAAVILLFAEVLSTIFGKPMNMLLMMPMGLFEIFLGVWLMIKGFDMSKDQTPDFGPW